MVPCAVVAVAAIVVLGPPLGRLLSPAHNPYTLLADAGPPHPEPTEHARYLIAICAPLLGALATAAAPRWLARAPARAVTPIVLAAQAGLGAIVVASIVAQYRDVFTGIYLMPGEPPLTMRYFTPATLTVAALLALATAGALRSASLRRRAAALLFDEPRRRALLLGALAVLATAIWMLHAVHSDLEIGNAPDDVRYHLGFTIDETFAVLNGRTPLVSFTAQYASLWPFAIALTMLALGKTVLVFTTVLCTITGLALLAIFGVLRRVTRSAAAALLLYLPFLATSLYLIAETLQNRSSVGSYYASFPLRYALPFAVAWATARRIDRDDGDRARALWPLFTLAGIALLNNADFGLAALGATIAALLWSARRLEPRLALRIGGAVAAGLATALALVCVLTLACAGDLPQLGRLVDYARTYTIGGFALMPIPGVLGVHLIIYLTYVAAILVATVRALRGARNRVLTGMLAWAGVFGLGAGFYWVGRSHPFALKQEFSAWALALALLTVVAVRELSTRRVRRTALGALLVLAGFGVTVCSLAQTPTPWGQIERLNAPFTASAAIGTNPLAPPRDPRVRRFIASLADGPNRFVYKRGAPVALLLTTGHRDADAYGVVDVSPYTGVWSLQTVQRVEAIVRVLRAAGGNTIILPDPLDQSILPLLTRDGFALLTAHGLRAYVAGRTRPLALPYPWEGKVIKMVDTRNLYPRALR